METSGPPVVRTREQVAEEGEGGGSRTIIFGCLTHMHHTLCNINRPTSDIRDMYCITLEWIKSAVDD